MIGRALASTSMLIFTSVLLSLVLAAVGKAAELDESRAAPSAVPFKYASGHILLIPAKVCGKDCSFILDTGCGVNVISQTLANSLSCKFVANHSGRRMSGQELRMQIVDLPALQIGNYNKRDVPVASWNLNDLLGGEKDLAQVQGFVSLDFFRDRAFTLDYEKNLLIIETDSSLKQRLAAGRAVPAKVILKGGCEAGIKIPLQFSNGKKALAEVDTGSGSMIIDLHYMKSFGVKETDANVEIKKGKDETGHAYKRVFCNLPADVFLAQGKSFKQQKPRVQFQSIIHEALVGDSFLRNFVVTYDLPHKRMIFAQPAAPSTKQTSD